MKKGTLIAAMAAAMAATAPLVTGCTTEAYCWSCGQSSSTTTGTGGTSSSSSSGTGGDILFNDGGPMDMDGGDAGDSSDACTADTLTDPMNCGSCGNVCNLLGAFPKCVAGECVIESCAPGHYDINGIGSDGCEYGCTTTNGGVETCDGKDNNCDGTVDEGFDLQTDPLNCGSCGNVCNLSNATATCAVVMGVPTCVVATCADGFSDLDKLGQNGCEYQCPVWPAVAETCNDKDDNCDGLVNEGNPGGGQTCESNCPGGTCLGECTPGTTLCAGTSILCVGGQGPTLEVCDGKDNNCDGTVDDGFDLQNDPLNCGVCGKVCTAKNAIGGCQNGQCVISACLPGHANLDGDAQNGCEYTCPVNPPTVESCNGLDDDCNGVVDDASVITAQKPPASGCLPKPGTPCAGADFQCKGTQGWRCNYGPGVEVDANGKLAIVETKCDGIDGNCNGQVDESFSDLGTQCDNGLLGACRDLGKKICDPANDAQTLCDLSVLPDPVPGAPTAETCNGIDDDCDGMIDDGVVDDMVKVTKGAVTFYMDRYEASRPDATATSPGLNEARRCVNSGVLPWTFTTQAEAAAACAATGARLCTATELETACAGAATTAYPYGASYQPLTCNGLDYDGIPGGSNDDVLRPTGSAPMCAADNGIIDLSGNAAEWTSTVTGNTGAPQNLSIYMAKGGSYKTPALGLTCQFTLSRYASNAILPELGFRCCHD
ncbi:Tryptophan synthase alpha chain [Minicystis rosea]|nr:Tryptophan synthase alpha chain [Minicystis rosea]